MKPIIMSLLCILTGQCFVSCQDNEPESNGTTSDDIEIVAPIEGTLLDGGVVSGINLYCIPKEDDSSIGQAWEVYYSSVKTLTSYSNLNFYLMIEDKGSTYRTDNRDESNAIGKIEEDYYKEKSSFIIDAYRDYESKVHAAGWPVLYTAYVNGDVNITCDKELFGIKPGDALNSHISIFTENQCIPIGIEKSTMLYNYGDELPTIMGQYLIKETWIQPKYILNLLEEPSERYEELTFYISFPMLIEHARDMAVAAYKGTELKEKYTDVVYTSECTIRFNWN